LGDLVDRRGFVVIDFQRAEGRERIALKAA
jgi:hypothetical protein